MLLLVILLIIPTIRESPIYIRRFSASAAVYADALYLVLLYPTSPPLLVKSSIAPAFGPIKIKSIGIKKKKIHEEAILIIRYLFLILFLGKGEKLPSFLELAALEAAEAAEDAFWTCSVLSIDNIYLLKSRVFNIKIQIIPRLIDFITYFSNYR